LVDCKTGYWETGFKKDVPVTNFPVTSYQITGNN
jgi:hypothetical protein